MVQGLRTDDKIWEEGMAHTFVYSLPWLYVELEPASQAEQKVRTAREESGSVSQWLVPYREPRVSINVRSRVWAGHQDLLLTSLKPSVAFCSPWAPCRHYTALGRCDLETAACSPVLGP